MALVVRAEVAVALAIGPQGKRGHRNPSHGEFNGPSAMQKAMAANRHHVRHRGEPEVTIERPGKTLGIAAGGRKIELPILADADAPRTALIPAKIKLAAPAFTAAGRLEP